MTSKPTGYRVLLIEDEMMVAGMLRRMIQDLGHTVVDTATTVDEAIQKIDRGGIDAAILDINLDGEMSYPAADKLTSCRIPFVFATGYGSYSLPDDYYYLPLLKKPFRRSALADALMGLMDADKSNAGALTARGKLSLAAG